MDDVIGDILSYCALACSALCIHIGTIFSSTFYIWACFFSVGKQKAAAPS